MNLIEKLGLENAKVLNGMLQKHAVPESWRIAVINGMWQRSSVGFTHGELRTAIANHEKCQHEWNETTSNGDVYRFFVCKHCDSTQNYVPFKDDNPSHFDHCTDIRNHISPLTGVIEG